MSESNLNDSPNPETSPSNELPEKPLGQKLKEGPLLMIGGVGCVLLLCVGVLVGSWMLFAGSRLSAASDNEIAVEHEAGPEDDSVEAVAPEKPTDDEETTTAEAASSGQDVTPSKERGQDKTPLNNFQTEAVDEVSEPDASTGNAQFGSITFAPDVSDSGDPIEPDFSFEAGLTEIHALFEYSDLNSNVVWTQVWYHDGQEILSTSQPWLAEATGVYDYVVDAGGEPIPAGQWALEFYIGDELLTAGSFMIEESDDETSDAEAPPELADIPKVFRLAYTKWNGEKHDLYIGDTAGQQERFILRGGAGPSWSPDGQYLFFYGEEGVDQQVINGVVYPLPGATNGVIRVRVAPLPANVSQLQLFQGHGWNDGTARWTNVSPDGSMIAYDGSRGGGRRIYFLGSNANQQFRFEIIGEQADWSPNGQQIVYRSGRDNRTGIWISNRDDSGHTLITNEGTDSFPAWSPNGKQIAFSREVGGNVDIYALTLDSGKLTRLTDAPGQDTLPIYLPNGDLAFRSARGGSWGIWKMHGDGSEQTQIISNAPVGPDWSFSRMSVLR